MVSLQLDADRVGLRFRLQIHTAFEHCLSFETLDEKKKFHRKRRVNETRLCFPKCRQRLKTKYSKGNNDVSHHLNGVNLAQ